MDRCRLVTRIYKGWFSPKHGDLPKLNDHNKKIIQFGDCKWYEEDVPVSITVAYLSPKESER